MNQNDLKRMIELYSKLEPREQISIIEAAFKTLAERTYPLTSNISPFNQEQKAYDILMAVTKVDPMASDLVKNKILGMAHMIDTQIKENVQDQSLALARFADFEPKIVKTALVKALKHESWAVRTTAMQGLGYMGAKAQDVVSELAPFIEARYHEAMVAIEAIGNIGGPQALLLESRIREQLNGEMNVAKKAGFALAKINRNNIENTLAISRLATMKQFFQGSRLLWPQTEALNALSMMKAGTLEAFLAYTHTLKSTYPELRKAAFENLLKLETIEASSIGDKQRFSHIFNDLFIYSVSYAVREFSLEEAKKYLEVIKQKKANLPPNSMVGSDNLNEILFVTEMNLLSHISILNSRQQVEVEKSQSQKE